MTPYVALEQDGDVFLLPTAIGAKVFAVARRPEFVVLGRACRILRERRRLSGGETFVDVGAHIGTTSIPALSHQGFGRAVAVEPDPDHLPLLRANVALNGLDDRVKVVAAAISDAQRTQAFAPGVRMTGDRWMKGQLSDEATPGTVEVATVTLDGLAEEGVVDPSTTGLLWFDCAGSEDAALASGSRFLERRIPIVLPLRHQHVSQPTRLVERLRTVYDQVVDLRSPRLSEPLETWTPVVRPLDDLGGLVPEGKKLTDVLLFAEDR